MDPAILVLDLEVTKASGSEATARGDAQYEEKTHQRYEQVEIRPCNVVVIVEEVL
jgi:hypothetical protein